MGKNNTAQLGINKLSEHEEVVTLNKYAKNVKTSSCGKDFSCYVTTDGKLYTFGSPEYGQLGNGTDGKTLERAGKFTFEYVLVPTNISEPFKKYGADFKLADVSSGQNHSIVSDEEGRIWSFGFGGYGRLGQSDNKDRYEPTPVDLFHQIPPPPNPNVPKFMQRQTPKVRATRMACGASASYAVVGKYIFLLI